MLSERVKNLKPSPTISITAKVRELKAKGENIIGFGAGEPDIDTPEFIKEACYRALKDGKTKYPPAGGIPELREALSEKLRKKNKVDYKPSEIVVTVGAKLGIYLILSALLNEGDEVLLPAPYWVTYEDQIRLCGGVPVYVPTDESFSLTYDEVKRRISERTKLIIINSPNNPSGAIYRRKEVEKIVELCLERGIYILSDECYEEFIFENKEEFFSIASLSDEVKKITFTVNSFSKTYSMTGWRVGYVACEESLAKVLTSLNSNLVTNTSTFAQYGALEALTNPEGEKFIKEINAIFKRRRDIIYKALKEIPNIKVVKPSATFFIFPDFSYYSEKVGGDVKLSEVLLEREKVAVVPGSAFGYEGYIRLSFALDEESIKEGIERIKKALETL